MDVCIPVDVEDVVRDFLADHLEAEVITYPLPDAIADECVCVRKTGGTRSDMVCDESLVSIDCRAADEQTALSLALQASALMAAASGNGRIHGASLNATAYLNPDPKRPDLFRYSFAALVTCRAETKEI